MLKQRVITAVLLLPVVIWLFSFGPKSLVAFFYLLGVAGCSYEASSIIIPRLIQIFAREEGYSEEKGSFQSKQIIYTSVFISLVLFVFSTFIQSEAGRGLLSFGFLGTVLIGVFSGKSILNRMSIVMGLLLSVVYGLVPWLAIWDLYELGSHSRYIFLLLAIVWCGDTGAYFGGRSFGKHKLAPTLSPKKTWEGSISGLIASVIGGLVVNALFANSLGSLVFMVSCALVTGSFAQAGDLVESSFKRFAGVKDSGTIFPGHGGLLDRVDGLLLGAPVLWLGLYLFGS